MGRDVSLPFRGSEAVRAGELTWAVLRGPRFRCLGVDTYVAVGTPDSELLRIRAAAARGGSSAVVTGWSACVVHGLDVASRTMPVEIAVPDRRLRRVDGTVARRVRLEPDDVELRDGLATTTPLRTAYDLAARSGPEFAAVDRVIGPLTDAVVAVDALARIGPFSADDLVRYAAQRPRARGVRRLRTVAALLDPRSDSPPETRARVKLVLAGLPRPVLQYPVRDGRGIEFLLDLAWPTHRVAVEYDGRDHARSDRRGRDIDRIDALRAEGWIIVVITAPQLARPSWVTDRVREALVSRGWRPDPGLVDDWAHVVAENEIRSRSTTARR